MIIKDTETLRKYLSVNGSVDHSDIKPYLRKAERSFLKPVIGKEQLAVFDSEVNDEIVKEAQELAQEVVASYGYFLYLPIGAVQITGNGIHVVANENTKTATDKQFKELQRSFLKSAHEALDELLAFMELSADKFIEWFNSDKHSIYKDLLVNQTEIFNKYYHIFNSRQTFMALQSNLRIVEDRFIKSTIGKELLSALKSNQTDEDRKEVKQLLQQSIVAFTIMLTVDNGMFVLDAKGMHMRFDVLPYEKTVTNVNLKVNDFLIRTKDNKKIEGEEYLKNALETIKNQLIKFPEFKEKTSVNYKTLTKTKSIVGL